MYSPVYFTNYPEGHLWSKELTSKYFPNLKRALRDDLFRYCKHIEQSEIYSAAEFIGVQPDVESEGGTFFSSIHNFEYQDLDYDAQNIWNGHDAHFMEIQQFGQIRNDGKT